MGKVYKGTKNSGHLTEWCEVISMETSEYLAFMVGLGFIHVILWYLTLNNWMPSGYLGPIDTLLGLVALVLTAIFVVEAIHEHT
jgi:hypothetical protein